MITISVLKLCKIMLIYDFFLKINKPIIKKFQNKNKKTIIEKAADTWNIDN